MEEITYSNPCLDLIINDWPFGSELRTRAHFWIETNKRGQRAGRQLIDPRTGRACAPKFGTYHKAARIVTGSNGRTYIIGLSPYGNGIQVMRGDLKLNEEYLYLDADDAAKRARAEAVKALFDALPVSPAPAAAATEISEGIAQINLDHPQAFDALSSALGGDDRG